MEKEVNSAFSSVYNSKSINRIFIIVIFIGLLLYYLGIANMYIWLIALFMLLTTCNKIEIGFFSLLYGSSLFGRMFASQQLYLSTIVIFLLLGIILLYKEIFKTINMNLHSYLFMLILISFFTVSYLLGPQTSYAHEKILKLTVRGVIWLTAFLIFVQTENISGKRISLAFLILSLFYISQSFQIYGLKPTSLFDFSFFRDFCNVIGRNNNHTLVVNYQTLGYLSLASSVFWIITDDFWENERFDSICVLLITFWIIALSGTRQTLFSFIIILILRIFIERGTLFSFSNLLIGFSFIGVFFLVINNIGSQYFDQVLSTDATMASRLHRDTNTPFEVININPLMGIGFGGYPLYANKDYPHNFFLEIVSELGIIGLIIILLLIIFFILSNNSHNYVKFLSVNGAYIFPLIILFFLRGQISGDLSDSVSFICVLLSCRTLNIEQENFNKDEIST